MPLSEGLWKQNIPTDKRDILIILKQKLYRAFGEKTPDAFLFLFNNFGVYILLTYMRWGAIVRIDVSTRHI